MIWAIYDTKTPRYYRECGFENVSKYPIIFEGFWMLSHELLYVNDNMTYANKKKTNKKGGNCWKKY